MISILDLIFVVAPGSSGLWDAVGGMWFTFLRSPKALGPSFRLVGFRGPPKQPGGKRCGITKIPKLWSLGKTSEFT